MTCGAVPLPVHVSVAGPFDGSTRPCAFVTSPDVDVIRTGVASSDPVPSTWACQAGSSAIGELDSWPGPRAAARAGAGPCAAAAGAAGGATPAAPPAMRAHRRAPDAFTALSSTVYVRLRSGRRSFASDSTKPAPKTVLQAAPGVRAREFP